VSHRSSFDLDSEGREAHIVRGSRLKVRAREEVEALLNLGVALSMVRDSCWF
jgi:hypothetical protein